MKEKRLKQIKQKEKRLCIVKYSSAPDFITCPECGFEIQLWTGDDITRCLFCGHRVFSRETTLH